MNEKFLLTKILKEYLELIDNYTSFCIQNGYRVSSKVANSYFQCKVKYLQLIKQASKSTAIDSLPKKRNEIKQNIKPIDEYYWDLGKELTKKYNPHYKKY